ncbi:unnamed protein product [Mesocestoides corti]|uniref:Uncharacterized protein n=1 Tax=Mesocestoides corti TaxID=53468 RepID=A0A0R3UCE8_MESCO|nr:unnamed protein product [Mesocestoides corti]
MKCREESIVELTEHLQNSCLFKSKSPPCQPLNVVFPSERWASSRLGLERITTKPYIRSNINGTQIQRYFNFPLYYRVARYEDGHWTEPYYVCDGFFNGWVITYAAPFFGYLESRQTLDFM